MIKRVIIILIFAANVFALNYDFNADNWVDFEDFATFANGWQTTYDINDLAAFCDEWLTGTTPNVAPVISDCNFTAYTFITKILSFTATDDGSPYNKMQYYVSPPNDINCYIQDYASGCGRITDANYRVRNDSNSIWFAADNNEVFTFKWKVSDGELFSDEANCVVTVSPNPHDHLSFGGGYVEANDSNYLEWKNGTFISFFIQTRTPFCTIMKKRGSGAGYEIKLESGRPKLELYDATSLIYSVRGDYRIDNGQWWWCNIFKGIDANYVTVIVGQTAMDYQYTTGQDWTVVDINNSEKLQIGYGYKWELDNVRYVSDYNFSDVLLDYYGTDIRNTAGDSGMFLREATVRWKMDEGSGATITDDKKGLIGTLTGDVFWTPKNWYWTDINVLR